jgi:hypothetical protein
MLCAQVAGQATHKHYAENARFSCLLSLVWSGTVLIGLGQRSRLVTWLQMGHRSRPAFREALAKYTDALREAFAAYREYHHLASNRIPHDKALRKVFGLDEARMFNRRKSWTAKSI